MSTQTNPPLYSPAGEKIDRNSTQAILRLLANLVGLALTWACWLWLALSENLSPAGYAVLAVGGVLALLPLVYLGRWLLDRCGEPCPQSVQRAGWITLGVHYLVAICFGGAIISAVHLAQISLRGDLFSSQAAALLGTLLMVLGGIGILLVTINLVVKGWGLPFAISLTRLVVSDWIYAWTRNPMVLSALAFLVGLGLWLQSALFLIWVLVVVSPVMMVYLQVYEERELELRFGNKYREYKARTPRFLPRKPLD